MMMSLEDPRAEREKKKMKLHKREAVMRRVKCAVSVLDGMMEEGKMDSVSCRVKVRGIKTEEGVGAKGVEGMEANKGMETRRLGVMEVGVEMRGRD